MPDETFRKPVMNERLKAAAPPALRGQELGPRLRFALQWPAYRLWRWTVGRGKRLERPIFLIGSARSGTSIAARLFGQHPDVANFSEARAVWTPGYWKEEPNGDDVRTAADVTAGDVERLHGRFLFHQLVRRKPRFLNKNPRSSLQVDYIQAVFPDAVFIHVVRDGRAVAESALRLRDRFDIDFPKPPGWPELQALDEVEREAWRWRGMVTYVLERRDLLGERYHQFRYEDLCRDCRGVLGEAYAFAGLRTDAGVLEGLPPALDSRNEKWRERLTSEQIRRIVTVQGDLLAELGYPLTVIGGWLLGVGTL